MLHYFPTPYPDELWYSVLCRYYIRSGNTNLLVHRGKGGFPTSLIFPDSSIYNIINQLPEGLFSVRDMILQHTLFPYFCRMYPVERKEFLLQGFYVGAFSGNDPAWKVIARSVLKLKYCPICAKEEVELYGESYWHREHQIPCVTVCRKHKCRLIEYKCDHRLQLAEKPVFPDKINDGGQPDYFVQPYELMLAKTLYGYMTLPIDAGPTDGYSNLYYGLEKEYRCICNSRVITLDTKKMYENILKLYGEKLTQALFGKSIAKYIPMKLRNWEFTAPERYAMLAAMIGQSPEITFDLARTKEHRIA